jgi:hypothetical protein
MGKIVSLFGRGCHDEPEPLVEILSLILALIRDVWRVVDDYVKRSIGKWHVVVIANDIRLMLRINVHAGHGPRTPDPESSAIDRSVKDSPRCLVWVEPKHFLKKLGVSAVPDGWKWIIPGLCRIPISSHFRE